MFQQSVNIFPAIGIPGDFASTNPRATVDAGAGGLVAGPGGVTVGNFAWIKADGKTVTSYGEAGVAPAGFVHREQQALITNYLGEESMVIPAGFQVVLHSAGDFFDVNQGPNASTVGGAVYARYADGATMTALPTGASATGSVGATFTAAASAASTALVITAVTGLISIGDTVSGSGITGAQTIIAQVSGTTGGAGTYTLSAVATCTGGTVTCFGSTLNVTAVGSGTLAVGDAITGTGIPAGASLAALVSGIGTGASVWTLNIPATAYAASTAVTVVAGIATNFVTTTAVAVNAVVKISTWGA